MNTVFFLHTLQYFFVHRVTPEVKVSGGPESNKLWVDSYSPKYYTDLLSDEVFDLGNY